MAIPESVRKASEKADEAYNKAYRPNEVQDTEANTDKAGQEHADSDVNTDNTMADTSIPQEVPAEGQSVDEPSERQQHSEKFEQKFKVLQGKYDAEVPRLHQQLDQMRKQNEQLASIIQSQSSTRNGDDGTKDVKPENAVGATPDEVEDYGQDFIDFVRRVAREEVMAKAKDLEGYMRNVDARVNSVGETVQLSAKEKFVAKLTEAVPDWEKWNVDQGFLNWLESADETTGYIRRPAFNEAASKYNVDRIIRMFNAYKESVGVSTARKAESQKSQKQRELERQVTPQTRGSSSVPARKTRRLTLRLISGHFMTTCEMAGSRGVMTRG